MTHDVAGTGQQPLWASMHTVTWGPFHSRSTSPFFCWMCLYKLGRQKCLTWNSIKSPGMCRNNAQSLWGWRRDVQEKVRARVGEEWMNPPPAVSAAGAGEVWSRTHKNECTSTPTVMQQLTLCPLPPSWPALASHTAAPEIYVPELYTWSLYCMNFDLFMNWPAAISHWEEDSKERLLFSSFLGEVQEESQVQAFNADSRI